MDEDSEKIKKIDISKKDKNDTAKQERSINRKRLDFTLIMTVSLGIISLCALVVSFYQARLMGQQSDIMFDQNKASALPILEIDSDKSFSGLKTNNYHIEQYSITATNKGNGPLIIENIEFKYNGTTVQNWEELFELYPGKDTLYLARSNDVLNNSVLLPGEKITVIDSNENTQLAQILHEMMEEVKLKVCYSSIYKDLFHDVVKGLDNRVTNDVEEISFCKIKKGANFQD